MKLLFDTIELLHFRMSNREKSDEIESLEKQNRLFATLGKTIESDLSKLVKRRFSSIIDRSIRLERRLSVDQN